MKQEITEIVRCKCGAEVMPDQEGYEIGLCDLHLELLKDQDVEPLDSGGAAEVR